MDKLAKIEELKISARSALKIAGEEVDFLHMKHRQDMDEIKLLNEEIRILSDRWEELKARQDQEALEKIVAAQAENNRLKYSMIVWQGVALIALTIAVVVWIL